jgi:neutral ceramidase
MTQELNRPHATAARALNVLCCAAGLLLTAGLSFAQDNPLRGGTSRIEITPTLPVTLAGYGSRKELSRGVHDPLSARAVAFSQGRNHLVLVSIDNLGFYNGTAEPLRQAVLDACRLRPSELFLCAIHTHSAPTLTLNPEKGHPNNVEHTKWLQGKLVEVVHSALQRLTPVQVGVGSGSSPVGVNRREVVQDNTGKTKIVLGRNPSLLTDREVQVLKITRTDRDELAGVLFAYCTHSTSLGPRNYAISGDVHGLAEQFLEKYLGAGVVTPGFAGASGNVDPWFRILPGFNTTNGWIPEPILLGTMLGEEVAQILGRIQKSATSGPIKTAIKTLQLPRKKSTDEEASATESPASFVMTAACVGDIAFVGLGGEVFNEIGLAIKKASPFPHTFVFTHCNGAAGYVPTSLSYPEGGYEVQSSAFAPGADDRLADEAKCMLTELQSAKD